MRNDALLKAGRPSAYHRIDRIDSTAPRCLVGQPLTLQPRKSASPAFPKKKGSARPDPNPGPTQPQQLLHFTAVTFASSSLTCDEPGSVHSLHRPSHIPSVKAPAKTQVVNASTEYFKPSPLDDKLPFNCATTSTVYLQFGTVENRSSSLMRSSTATQTASHLCPPN